MYLLEKISNKIANQVAIELKYDHDKQEVMAYGMFAILQIFLSIFLVAVMGVVFGVLIEALIISFSTSILRKYSGGVHASSPTICLIIGTIVCVGFALLSTSSFITNLNFSILFSIICFVIALLIFIKLAPVESKAKPISDKKKKKMKKGSLIMLVVYLVILMILYSLYMISKNSDWLRYGFCLEIGILWQTFTLTKTGAYILGGVDDFFIKLSKMIKKGGSK